MVLSRILDRLFVLYIALNMALCVVLFFPWALPRETISGLCGRWAATGSHWQTKVAALLGGIAEVVYFWEADHCADVYRCEEAARQVLYGKSCT